MTANPPKKRFGQHFLIDRNIIRKIVSTAGVAAGDLVLEIGPGRGALTGPILEAGARLVAIEVDRGLAASIKESFGANPAFEVIEGDALKISFTGLALRYGSRFKVVSNLPYNISGPLLSKLIEERAAFTALVLMFQKEVAERIAAHPGTKDYGALSVLCQMYTDVKKEFNVGAHLFRPVPKVASTVVSLKIRETPRVPVPDEGFFRLVVRAAFGMRRKTLLNALSVLGLSKEELVEALKNSSIDPKRRGESLSIAEFGALANALFDVTARKK